MNDYRRSLVWLILFVVGVEVVVILAAGVTRPPWGDEGHFVETVRLFGASPALETLKHYHEMSGPLPFALYAGWGKMVGYELAWLRLLSVVIALVSYLLFHRLLFIVTGQGRTAFPATAFLVLHPYMVGFSVFVFTDGLTIMFLILGLLAAYRRRPCLYALAVAGALLCRQYAVFFIAAGLVYHLVAWRRSSQEHAGWMFLGGWLGCVPYGALALFWGGLTPDNDLRGLYLEDGFSFNASYLTLYIALTFLYLLPCIAARWRHIYAAKPVIIVSLLLGWVYWLAPVGPSKYAVAIDVYTVGLFHKLLVSLYAVDWFSQAVFFAAFVLALPVVVMAIRGVLTSLRGREAPFSLFLDLAVLLFLAIMPFSYLGWEKYFMLLLPVLTVRLAGLGRSYRETAGQRGLSRL